ncbi:MAG TPA: hemerythrin domain-containing protein [Paracoccaceae bacterium]|nr:hemerythrin domain-containing protein [Paracoccaceae bacterium]
MSPSPTSDRESRVRGARAAAPPLGPGDCPLEALREVHFLQRQICLDMESLADTTTARPALALDVLTNLCRDLLLHHADEDEGLFPLLRQRALEEDEMDRLLTRLSADHVAIAAAIPPLLPALACMVDHALPAPEDRAALRALAQTQRLHMIIENAILLPLAQARLTDADRRQLIASMVARRASPPALRGPCARLSDGTPAACTIAQTVGANR